MDTLRGTFTAEVWHIGRHVAVDPSGYNWRLDGDEVEAALQSFIERRNWVSMGARQRVEVNHFSDRTQIIAIDTALRGVHTETVLSLQGCDQFIEVLQDAMTRPQVITENMAKTEHRAMDRQPDKNWIDRIHDEIRRTFGSGNGRADE